MPFNKERLQREGRRPVKMDSPDDKQLRLDLIHWLASHDAQVANRNAPLVSDTITEIISIMKKHGSQKRTHPFNTVGEDYDVIQ